MYFPKLPQARPILFDLGDTLINFSQTNPLPLLPQGTRLAYELMQGRGIRLPPLRSFRRHCRAATLRLYLKRLSVREIDLLATLRRLHRGLGLPQDRALLEQVAERFYQPLRVLGRVEEGVHRVLSVLVRAGHPVGIVSNTMVPGRALDRHLDEEGLLEFFPVRIYSCDVGVKKPHPRIFRAALQALNAKPQDTVFVGDTPGTDVRGARRLGMTTVLKAPNGAAPHPRRGPDFVIRGLVELPELIARLGPCYGHGPLVPVPIAARSPVAP